MTESRSPKSRSQESRSRGHFERLYRSNPDPWGFATSPYEHAKYRHTLDALPQGRFLSGLEAGCSIGVLTGMLAERCGRLVGVDIVEAPLQAARTRCADQPKVRFERMQVPADWPADRFDLMVFSEVLYFLSAGDIARCAGHVANTLLPGGTVVLVNWLDDAGTGTSRTGDPSAGDAGPDRFIAATKDFLRVTHQERLARYRLDLLRSA